MKNIFYFFSAIAVIALASCSKGFDANDDNLTQKSTEFTIIANAPEYDAATTKGSLGAVARVFWATGDEIDVYQVSGTTTNYLGVLTAETVSEPYTTATFKGTLTTAATSGNLAFIYPSNGGNLTCSMATQNITTNGRVPFCAYANTTYTSGDVTASSLDFTLASSYVNAIIMDDLTALQSYSATSVRISDINNKVEFTANEGKIGFDAVPESKGTITVNYSTAVSFSSTGKTMLGFAVPASASTTTSRTFVVSGLTKSSEATTYSAAFASSALGAAKFYSAGITDFAQVEFLSSRTFSVSDSKTVKFAKSNLYWDGSDWHFELNPWDYPTTWDANHVGHFYWTKTAAASYAKAYSDGTCTTTDTFFADGSDASHMLSVDGISDLYVLSKSEWEHLLKDRDNAGGLRKDGVKVCGQEKCLVIAPDDFTGEIADEYTVSDWATAEATGLVCIPPARTRYIDGTSVIISMDRVYGYIWSSTPYDKKQAYDFEINETELLDDNRSAGETIRLVKQYTE